MQNVIVNTLTLICPIFVKLFYVLEFYRDCTIMLTKIGHICVRVFTITFCIILLLLYNFHIVEMRLKLPELRII